MTACYFRLTSFSFSSAQFSVDSVSRAHRCALVRGRDRVRLISHPPDIEEDELKILPYGGSMHAPIPRVLTPLWARGHCSARSSAVSRYRTRQRQVAVGRRLTRPGCQAQGLRQRIIGSYLLPYVGSLSPLKIAFLMAFF